VIIINTTMLASIRRSFSTANRKKIGFIGIGNMGFPMVQNLLKHGHLVTVFDLAQEKLERAESEGARVACDVAELARDQDVCITILPTTDIVRETRMGDNGIYANAREGSLIIDSSTIAPEDTREMTIAGEKLGLRIADVPVSGGYTGAQKVTNFFLTLTQLCL
jgi:3-hydroxyisobutyrate dehydrogenase-like beta-hydroxyacid dehydrogenase